TPIVTEATPAAIALRADESFGSIPPLTTPSATSACASSAFSAGTTLPLPSSSPSTSVMNCSELACSAAASAEAALSALTLNSCPSVDMAIDETTGRIPYVNIDFTSVG